MKKSELKNALDALSTNRLVCDVAEWLIEKAKANREYQEDLYIYISDDGSYELENFVNVGGNSWIADPDALWIAKHEPSYADWRDMVEDIAELADVLDEPLETLIENIASWANCDEEDVSMTDAVAYVGGMECYGDALEECWENGIEAARWEYEEQAREIVDDFIESLYEQCEGGDI